MRLIRESAARLVATLVFLLLVAFVSSPATARDLLPFEPDDTLEEIQAKIDHNGYQFSVGHNPVFDLPVEEKAHYLSRRAPSPGKPSIVSEDIGPLADYLGLALPEAFDWRSHGGHTYIGPVRDQGSCGSCYSFGACAAAEGTYNKAMGLYDEGCADFSESFIIWCLGSLYDGFFGCDGSDYDYDELLALTVEGIIFEDDFPYSETAPEACTHWDDSRVIFDGWYRIPCGDIAAIKTAIYVFGVVDASVLVGNAFQAYDTGIYEDIETGCDADPCYYTPTNHIIALVGWDDAQQCWILRNSWGENWGESGYMRISYHAAHVACEACYLVYGGVVTQACTTLAAGQIVDDGAELRGSITPNGNALTWYFEYGMGEALDQRTPTQALPPQPGPVTVTAALSGLTSQTTYACRLVTEGSLASIIGDAESFTTTGEPVAPEFLTASLTALETQSIRIGATVHPHGGATTVTAVCTDAEGGTITLTLSDQPLEGTRARDVTAVATGLCPGGTYTVIIRAVSAYGSASAVPERVTLPHFFEGFEEDTLPTGWTLDNLTGSLDWEIASFNGAADEPASAHAGQYFTIFADDFSQGTSTRLLSPFFSVPGSQACHLVFWLCLDDYDGQTDELTVLVREGSLTQWTTLEHYQEELGTWTEITLDLPQSGGAFQLAFEAVGHNGGGVALDDISLTPRETPTETIWIPERHAGPCLIGSAGDW